MTPLLLTGKTALVVGANGAIGGETARQLAAAGATVILGHRNTPEETAAATKLAGELVGEGHWPLIADVGDTASLNAAAQTLTTKIGRFHILVNAAGFTKPVPHADLQALTDELIDEMFAVNWRGQFATIRAMQPLLEASGDGLIVSISSIAAFTGVGSSIAYCAAKAGIDVMTRALGRVLAPKIRVLAISPGVVDTNFVPGRGEDFNSRTAASTPLGRIGQPADIAQAILACATHLTFSTGHTVRVDGGRAL